MKDIKLFEQKQVRSHYDAEKEIWYFSVIDVIEILTGSTIPKRYWSDLKKKLTAEGSEVYEKIVRLKMQAEDGKMREKEQTNAPDLRGVCLAVMFFFSEGIFNQKNFCAMSPEVRGDL